MYIYIYIYINFIETGKCAIIILDRFHLYFLLLFCLLLQMKLSHHMYSISLPQKMADDDYNTIRRKYDDCNCYLLASFISESEKLM